MRVLDQHSPEAPDAAADLGDAGISLRRRQAAPRARQLPAVESGVEESRAEPRARRPPAPPEQAQEKKRNREIMTAVTVFLLALLLLWLLLWAAGRRPVAASVPPATPKPAPPPEPPPSVPAATVAPVTDVPPDPPEATRAEAFTASAYPQPDGIGWGAVVANIPATRSLEFLGIRSVPVGRPAVAVAPRHSPQSHAPAKAGGGTGSASARTTPLASGPGKPVTGNGHPGLGPRTASRQGHHPRSNYVPAPGGFFPPGGGLPMGGGGIHGGMMGGGHPMGGGHMGGHMGGGHR